MSMILTIPGTDINGFAFRLFGKISATTPQEDVFVSPFSAATALSLLNEGASGETASEINGLLGMDFNLSLSDEIRRADPSTTFESANSLWIGKGISAKCCYVRKAKKEYGAEVSKADFGSQTGVDSINDWCSRKTHGKIERILDSAEPSTRMMLINALYFNGEWEFSESPVLRSEDFRTIGGADVRKTMMYKTDEFMYSEDDMFRMVEIPYGNKSFSMYVLLPKDESPEGFSNAASRISAERWNNLLSKMERVRVRLAIPKFKMEYSIELNDILSELGMKKAFTPSAEFPGISRTPLMVSYVKQKTYLDVNERGTEAAAVTAIAMKMTSVGPGNDPIEFIANRPFLFSIREAGTGAVLFIGQKVK